MTDEFNPSASGLRTKAGSVQAEPKVAAGSAAKIQGFIGVIAITLGNVAAIVTHVDQLRQFVSKMLGTEWVYRFHIYIVYGACAVFLIGYVSLSYWLYCNFIATKTRWIKAGFCGAAFLAVGSMLLASYLFLFRPVDLAPLVKKQSLSHAQTILSQQVATGDDSGGFRFAQSGVSADVQAWTTAQCIVALLNQDAAIVKEAAPSIRKAFEYIERSRLKTQGDGWSYMRDINWGVTEINAWVALAYMYSLRANKAAIVWEPSDLPEIISRVAFVMDLILRRQNNTGGWGPIEKTSNPKHERTYSTIMAAWALAEAEQNGDVVKGHEAQYRQALTLGAKWLLDSYITSTVGLSGWWPNPSAKNPVGAYPALTAQTLFVLSESKVSHAFIGADPRYKEAVETFIRFAFDGGPGLEPITKRPMESNERPHDSDRYLEGRPETVEQSTFLWYPWTLAAATTLVRDPLFLDYQQQRFRQLILKLLDRADQMGRFVRNDQAIYPTAELLFAEGYYFSRIGLPLKTE